MGDTSRRADDARQAVLDGRMSDGFVAELRRRGVLRAIVAYAVIAFAVLQVVEPVLHGLRLPEWILTAIVVALAIGFPVTIVVSWAFDLTLQGFKRAAPAPLASGTLVGTASRWPLFAMTLAGVLLGALAAWLARNLSREPPRMTVAAADFVNETHDEDLNALSGLLITSLEQSRRLSVMTRSRMFDVLRQSGRGNVGRIDEALGREICRQTHVDALVLASIHKFGEVYAIDLKVIDPARNEHLFAAKEEGRGKESIPSMIDRLSERTRGGLREKAEEIAASRRSVSRAATANLEAYRHFFLAEELVSRGDGMSENALLESGRAADELRRAIELDPDFALAHFRLGFVEGGEKELKETEIALAQPDRLPAKELCHAQAVRTGLRGEWPQAIRLIRACADQFPDDKLILWEAGDWAFHRGETDVSVSYFDKTLTIDPTFFPALEHLLVALRDLDRTGEALERAKAYWARIPADTAYELLAFAQAAAGEPERALATLGSGTSLLPRSARLWLATARIHLFSGRPEEAEAADRALAAIDPNAAEWALLRLYAFRGQYQRLIAANTEAAAKALAVGDRARAGVRLAFKAYDLTYGPEDRSAAAQAAAQAASLGTTKGLFHIYRWLGMEREAALLVASPEAPISADLALAAARARLNGPSPEAIQQQEKLAAGNPDWKHGELYELARLHLEAGAARKAIAVLHKLQRTYPAGSGSAVAAFVHSYPRSFYRLGQAHERVGEPEEALAAYQRFLELWKDADPELKEFQDAQARVAALRVRTPR
jgi:eukaryotic-like serine/threonine-protein kinase